MTILFIAIKYVITELWTDFGAVFSHQDISLTLFKWSLTNNVIVLNF